MGSSSSSFLCCLAVEASRPSNRALSMVMRGSSGLLSSMAAVDFVSGRCFHRCRSLLPLPLVLWGWHPGAWWKEDLFGLHRKGPCVRYRVCGEWWSDLCVLSSFWTTKAGSWTEMHGKVLRSYRREWSWSLCRIEEGPVFCRMYFRLTKQLVCDGVFSVLGLRARYGVVLDTRILLYPSYMYLYLFCLFD